MRLGQITTAKSKCTVPSGEATNRPLAHLNPVATRARGGILTVNRNRLNVEILCSALDTPMRVRYITRLLGRIISS